MSLKTSPRQITPHLVAERLLIVSAQVKRQLASTNRQYGEVTEVRVVRKVSPFGFHSRFRFLTACGVGTARIVRLIGRSLRKGRGRLTVQIQTVLNPISDPFLFNSLGIGWRGDIESDGGEDDSTNAHPGFDGASGHPALLTANDWWENVALVPDSLQHSVQIAAQFDQPG